MSTAAEVAWNVAQVAKYLSLHEQTVYAKAVDTAERPAEKGEIPGFRVGRAWRFFQSEIDLVRKDITDPWALPSKRR